MKRLSWLLKNNITYVHSLTNKFDCSKTYRITQQKINYTFTGPSADFFASSAAAAAAAKFFY